MESKGSVRSRVLLVDDDPTFASAVIEGLRDIVPVVTRSTVAGALAASRDERWCAVIVDVGLEGDGTGLDVIAEIRPRDPTVPMLVYTALPDAAISRRACLLHAFYARKANTGTGLEVIEPFIRDAVAVAKTGSVRVGAAVRRTAERARLTRSEEEILAMATGGHDAREIAEVRQVTRKTVYEQCASMLPKLGVPTFHHAVRARSSRAPLPKGEGQRVQWALWKEPLSLSGEGCRCGGFNAG